MLSIKTRIWFFRNTWVLRTVTSVVFMSSLPIGNQLYNSEAAESDLQKQELCNKRWKVLMTVSSIGMRSSHSNTDCVAFNWRNHDWMKRWVLFVSWPPAGALSPGMLHCSWMLQLEKGCELNRGARGLAAGWMSCKRVGCVAVLNILLTYRLHSGCWWGGMKYNALAVAVPQEESGLRTSEGKFVGRGNCFY